MSSNTDKIIDTLFIVEGGDVDDVDDSGGRTRYGITQETANINGYDIYEITHAIARKIYYEDYLAPMKIDEIAVHSFKLAMEMSEAGIHISSHRTIKMLQRVLNVLNNRQKLWNDIDADGIMGSKTLFSLQRFMEVRKRFNGEAVIVEMFHSLLGNYYIKLTERREKDEKFIYGWFNGRILN